MRFGLKDFQRDAVDDVVSKLRRATNDFSQHGERGAVVLSAPTGGGKTIIAAAVLERLLDGDEDEPAAPSTTILWLTDQPSLNEQTRRKLVTASSSLGEQRLVTIESWFDAEELPQGRICFLNIQKLARGAHLLTRREGRLHLFPEVVANTMRARRGRFLLVLDEAHRGMRRSKNDDEQAQTITQKFLKGWDDFSMPPVPVVLGISATPERFERYLASGYTASRTVRSHVIDPDSVRASGLLKDKITIWNRAEAQSGDTTLLREGIAEWKRVCAAWATLGRTEGEMDVRPLLALQVEDARGKDTRESATDIEKLLEVLLEEVPDLPASGIAHAFEGGATITFGNRAVRYLKPEDIQDDRDARVVLFKTSLTTGWDCPRAEVLVSFRRAVDDTLIAQLIGRMVRTPLARRVSGDDRLNAVSLYLPLFDHDAVAGVLARLKASGDEALPVETIVNPLECARNERVDPRAFMAVEAVPTYVLPTRARPNQLRRVMSLAALLAGDDIDPVAPEKDRAGLPPDWGGRRGHYTWGPFAARQQGVRTSSWAARQVSSLVWSMDGFYGSVFVRFDEDNYPNISLAKLVPEAEARNFWADLAKELSTRNRDFEWVEDTSSLGENYGDAEGTEWSVGAYDEEKFNEFCHDIISDYFNELIKKDPDAAFNQFLLRVDLGDAKPLVEKLLAEDSEFPDEETMDFVHQFFNAGPNDGDDPDQIIRELKSHLLVKFDPEKVRQLFIEGLENTLPFKVASLTVLTYEDWKEALADKLFDDDTIQEYAERYLSDDDNLHTEIAKAIARHKFGKNPGEAVTQFVNEVTAEMAKDGLPESKEKADVVRKAIEEKHFSKKNVLDLAFEWVSSPQDRRRLVEDMSDYADAILGGRQIADRKHIFEVSKEDIAKLGIKSGVLFEEAPLKLISLRPDELSAEGRKMRHCVGDSPSYAREVAAGNIEIWSLRDRNNKRLFTLEVNGRDSRRAQLTGKSILQIKGTANRTPGYERAYVHDRVTSPDEVILWRYIFKKLGINPTQVPEFHGARALPEGQQLTASVKKLSASDVKAWRMSVKLDALAEKLRRQGAPKVLIARVEDAAFLLS